MDIVKLIKDRRTIKKFKHEQVKQEDILTWLNTAAMSPNHRMTEPWKILFVGENTRKSLNHKTNFGNAPVLFAVLSHKGSSDLARDENLMSTACFIQNFMLQAWATGAGVFWSSLGATDAARKILSVPDDYDVAGILAAGIPDEIPVAKPRTPIDSKIEYLK
ncbi:nitroreductase family protein [Peribacillus sp. SCS-26]|uniref:nitroreductase family protein n=1 Tax=Paraperibacillus marinus TaxID=3115295 RepID=UPI003905783B